MGNGQKRMPGACLARSYSPIGAAPPHLLCTWAEGRSTGEHEGGTGGTRGEGWGQGLSDSVPRGVHSIAVGW